MNKNKPIRVLHVVQRMEAGGTQAFLMNLYRNIDRSKVQFDFLVEYLDREFYDEEIEKLGGKIYYTNFRRTLNVFEFKRQLDSILKERKYKIIHIHATAIGKVCCNVAKKNNIPTIIAHTHNNGAVKDWKYYPKKFLRWIYRKGPTDFFACSEEAGKYTFGSKNVRVIKNAIDTSKYIEAKESRSAKREELGIDKNDFVIGNIGRLHHQKNQLFLLDIFAEIKKKKNNAKLLMVGNGPLKESILKKAKELKIEDNLFLLSNRKDIPEFLSTMDVFVLPSLFEGLGIVAIEAQAAGLPVILSSGVSKEAKISNSVTYLDLNEGAAKWADCILVAKKPKTSSIEMLQKAGYDMKTNASFIQAFYEEKGQK